MMYLKLFEPFGNGEEFEIVRYFLESRTLKHKIDHCFIYDLAKVIKSSTIISFYSMDHTLHSTCEELLQ